MKRLLLTVVLTLSSLTLLSPTSGCGSSGPSPDEMPVGRIHFEVSNGAVRLRWNYPSSGAASHFEVQRRVAGYGQENVWIDLGRVDRAEGPAGTDENYEYADGDDSLTSGTQYIYRITAVAGSDRVPRETIQILYSRQRAPQGIDETNPIEQVLEEIARNRPALAERMQQEGIDTFASLTYKVRRDAFPRGSRDTLESYIQTNYEDLVVTPAADCALAFADWLVNDGGMRRASNEAEKQRDLERIVEAYANEAINEDLGPIFGHLRMEQSTLIGRLDAHFTDLGQRTNGRFGQVDYTFRVELREVETSTFIWAKEFRWSRTFRY